MKPDFMDRTAKIIAEVRTRTCIDKIDTEVLEEILQEELNKYYDELNEYYDDVYAEGRSDGYALGYADGRSDGYTLGYEDGYDERHYDGSF